MIHSIVGIRTGAKFKFEEGGEIFTFSHIEYINSECIVYCADSQDTMGYFVVQSLNDLIKI